MRKTLVRYTNVHPLCFTAFHPSKKSSCTKQNLVVYYRSPCHYADADIGYKICNGTEIPIRTENACCSTTRLAGKLRSRARMEERSRTFRIVSRKVNGSQHILKHCGCCTTRFTTSGSEGDTENFRIRSIGFGMEHIDHLIGGPSRHDAARSLSINKNRCPRRQTLKRGAGNGYNVLCTSRRRKMNTSRSTFFCLLPRCRYIESQSQ